MSERPRSRRAEHLERLHRTADVPQANKLENVRQLAAAVRDGVRDTAALLEMLGVDDRHFAYYRQAATILGLVRVSENELSLTDLGRELLGTAEGSREERACFLEAMRGARALKPFASFFLGQELPHDEIAKRLQALTGLSYSTAVRRAATLIQWRKYITESLAPTKDGPVLPDLAGEIEARVRRHNALAKQEFRAWLEKLDPRRFEELVAALCGKLGWTDVRVVGGTGDGGIDITAKRPAPGQHNEPIAVQVKRYSHPVGPRVVRELIGTVATGRFVKGLLVTTADFTPQAREEAARDVRIQLVAGMDLVDLLAEHGVVLRYGAHREITRAE
ncbi:restriction endonuclease [Anaeromyxobacter sp. PSR-1]|uniref:restriction endonuclease n=1 Tax=Anaeromyxobacter sp. PSR-1 TaxID=1300915 RepID=UPI0005E7A986|nr:restriction endonuclease [Anaeromyxobacter sp. PSR-1]GAO01450.1 restriction endonuclease [Anaeromyxobacter sp. PSR-1]